MAYRVGLKRSSVVVLLVAAGAAQAAMTVTPSDVLTWGGTGQGRSLAGAQPAGYVWAWNNTVPSNVAIDGNGRVYFQCGFATTPQVGTIPATSTYALFTATGAADLGVYDGIRDGGTHSGYQLGNSTLTTRCMSTGGGLRVSGGRVGVGVQISLGSPAIIESGPGTNNTAMLVGTSSGAGIWAQQNDQVTLTDINGIPVAAGISASLKSIGQQFSEMNAAGTLALANLTVPTAAGVFTNTANATAAPFGNNAFLATKSPAGGYTVIAQGGQPAPGVPMAVFQNGGSTGVGGPGLARINRAGQVAYDAKLCTNFPVTASSDNVAYIHTTGVGSTLVWREGQVIPDAAGSPDAGGALFGHSSPFMGGGFAGGKACFSDAGLLFSCTMLGGDTLTSGDSQNDSALFLATDAKTARLLRRNDPLAGLGADVNFGVAGSHRSISNSGQIVFGSWLQGPGVIKHVAVIYNVSGPLAIPVSVNTPGVQGDDNALLVGTASGGFTAIARTGQLLPGDPVPGTQLRFRINPSALNLCMNDAGSVIFMAETTPYAPGAQMGTAPDGPLSSVLPDGPKIYYGWSSSTGLVEMFVLGSQIEVDPGVFKTLSGVTFNDWGNNDGGSHALNENNAFVVKMQFTDSSWAIVKMQLPAATAAACCMADGSCTLTTQAACGGTWLSASTACQPANPCPQPSGACCRGSTCAVEPAAACVGGNASYAGNGTVCNAPGNSTTPCCMADYNQSGAVSVQDIFDFLAGYFAGDANTDVNGSGSVSVQDIFDYLAAYFAGCV